MTTRRMGKSRALRALAIVSACLMLASCLREETPRRSPPLPTKVQENWPREMPQVIAELGEDTSGTYPEQVKNLIEKVGDSVIRIPVTLSPEGFAVVAGRPTQKIEDILVIGSGHKGRTDHLWFDLELVTGHEHGATVERNSGSPEQYVAAVFTSAARAKFTNLVISSYDWNTLPLVHSGVELNGERVNGQPMIPVVALFHPGFQGDPLEAAGKLGADGVGLDYLAPDGRSLTVTKDLLARAHHQGLKVFPRVIDDPDDMQRQLTVCASDGQLHLDRCVDGIVTDHPDQLEAVLNRLIR